MPILIFLASLNAFAENLPIPPELTRGKYHVTSGTSGDACFEAEYTGKSSMSDDGGGIWFNARTLIDLSPDSRVADDLQPGCFEHTTTTSQDDGKQTTLVTTSTEECKGKRPKTNSVTIFTITNQTVEDHVTLGDGSTWFCNWRRSK